VLKCLHRYANSSRLMASGPKDGLKIAAAVAAVFMACIVAIVYFLMAGAISAPVANLLFIALLGLYFGFGVLFGVYRLMNRLK
jgi:hypothetical protein